MAEQTEQTEQRKQLDRPGTREKTFDPKPKVVQNLYEVTRISANPALRDLFLDRLRGSEADFDYVDLLFTFNVISREAVEHMKKHWFGYTPNGRGEWFKNEQPLRAKFRAAMTYAFSLSQARNVPIVAYWVVPMEIVDHIILPHETHISMFRMTPYPPGTTPIPRMGETAVDGEQPAVR
jgi:hypothetical protein